MEINKARLAAGNRDELLKLARSIKATVPASEAHPLASQFFGDNGTEIRHLPLDQLTENLAGAEFNERSREIEDAAFAQTVRDQDSRLKGMARPTATADVSMIGSGWTPSKPISVATGAKAATTTGRLERALLNNRLAKAATPNPADSAILTATLKSIIHELLGLGVEHFDASTLKTKLVRAIKAAPPALQQRLTKALNVAQPDSDVSLEELIRLGAKVTKTGNTLNISV